MRHQIHSLLLDQLDQEMKQKQQCPILNIFHKLVLILQLHTKMQVALHCPQYRNQYLIDFEMMQLMQLSHHYFRQELRSVPRVKTVAVLRSFI